jgi:hypothetical protein
VPKFFFTVRSPHFDGSDTTGIDLRAESDARSYALRIVQELKRFSDFDAKRFEILVRDENFGELFIVPFDEHHLH